MNQTTENRFWSGLAKRPLPLVLAITMFAGACSFLSDAISQTSEDDTVTTPAPKPTDQAAQDLRKNPPLDPLKLGDPMPQNLFVELSKLINPAVVSITTSQAVRQVPTRYRDPLQEFLEEFYGYRGSPPMSPGRSQPVTALGTGFIIREDGLIITNNHVIEQADIIKVQLDLDDSEEFYEAEVVGRDARTDLALIKINAKKKLPVARLGSSKAVQVGEWVAAIGNPYGHAHTVTKGIVSAVGREISEINRLPFIQTDASINPGNSGGPLVNSHGYVIGVNTAIDARAQGIGFAIPIDQVKQIIKVLETEGRVRRGFIGVNIADVNPELAASLGMEEPSGVLVAQVLPGGPADKAGIKPYDIIMDFGGRKTENSGALLNAVADTPIGKSAKVKVWRYDDQGRKKEHTLTLKVAEHPDDEPAPSRNDKPYFGQKAPFDLGFKVADFSSKLAQEFGLAPDSLRGPIITDVQRNSPASATGLNPGDVILDVNRQPVQSAKDVIKALRKGRNIMRVARGHMVVIVPIGR